MVGEIKDEAVGVKETKSSSLGFDLNTQKSNNSASTAVSSQPVLRLTSGVSPYHIQTSGSKSLHRPQLCGSPARPRAVPAEGTQDGKWRVMNSPSLRVVPSAGAEGRGKDRLPVGAFTISRSHAVSRGARVGSPAAEIIATFVCTSSRCVCARFCASEPVRSDHEQAQAVAPVPGRALCVSWRTSADYSN